MLSIPVANGPHGFGEFDCSAPPIPNARISALSLEHDDLDSAIDALVAANTHDDLIVARLKKRRLQIRDEIASLMARSQTRDAPDAALPALQMGADMDGLEPHAMREAAPRPGSGSFVIGIFVTLLTILMLVLGWSAMADSVNQTLAQVYLLSLVVAANG